MNVRSARRVLLAALAISLLLHAILAGYLRWPRGTGTSQEPQIIVVRHVTIARIVPHTPAPARPIPTHPPQAAAAHAKIAPPALTHTGTHGPPATAGLPAPGRAPPSAAPKVTASPQPVAGGACVRPDASPSVSASPPVADIPPEARIAKVSGTAAIAVSLDAQGRVTGAKVAQSSGSTGLDQAALQMAQNATYAPKLTACKPVPGDYTFTVKFVAW